MLPRSDLLQEVHGEETHFAAGVDFHITIHLLALLHDDLWVRGVQMRLLGPHRAGRRWQPPGWGGTWAEQVSAIGLGEVGRAGLVMQAWAERGWGVQQGTRAAVTGGGLEGGWGRDAGGSWRTTGCDHVVPSHLILLECDLPDLPVAHKGACHLVHPLACPYADDEVWREVANFFTDLPLKEVSGWGGGSWSQSV